jgi:hypothetical protein
VFFEFEDNAVILADTFEDSVAIEKAVVINGDFSL